MKAHILVIRFSALGDVAMTVPVVDALARQYPDVRITVLSRGFARPLFENLAPNVRFMEADVKNEYRGLSGLNTLYRRLAAKQFTHVADLHAVLRSSFLRMRFNLGRYHVAHIDKHRSLRRKLVGQKHHYEQLGQLPTSFESYADVFARLGFPISQFPFRSLFPPQGGNLELVPALKAPEHEDERWIGIAPFAAHQGKTYPPELMERVVERLAGEHPHLRIMLFGRGEQEDRCFTQWSEKYKQCIYVSQYAKDMKQELILMSHLDVMVSMDSANMHLASLTGTPVVSVWGATHPSAGFMGWRQDVENAVQLQMDCRPCSIFGQKPCRRGDLACLYGIKPEMIVEKINKVLTQKTTTEQ